jgi:ribosomal-protein-alanine N-acetyltransferase
MARITTLPAVFPFADPDLPYIADWMRSSDVRQVMPIEKASFPAPWPASAYRYELNKNDLSNYLVLRTQGDAGAGARVVAYGGFWLIVDEGHISTLAVDPAWRGRSLGEWMLVILVETAILRGAGEVTLEVRASNHVAQALYRKYGFVQVGLRRGYYHDNHEDALIMTTPRVDDRAFQQRYQALVEALHARLTGASIERDEV